MEKYTLDYSARAEADMRYHLKSGNKSRLRKIDQLLRELEDHPREGTGKPEQLKHDLTDKFSRRITGEHRIVYRVDDDARSVVIYQMKDHYVD